jgi:hypothetical protein
MPSGEKDISMPMNNANIPEEINAIPKLLLGRALLREASLTSMGTILGNAVEIIRINGGVMSRTNGSMVIYQKRVNPSDKIVRDSNGIIRA